MTQARNSASNGRIEHDALPDRVRRKYYVVASESEKDGPTSGTRLYADARGEYLAFKVTEDRLVTRLAAAEVIRDMVSVAQHRRWDALHVRGSVEFRREAWLEASARGIEVHGYRPIDGTSGTEHVPATRWSFVWLLMRSPPNGLTTTRVSQGA